MRAYLDICEEVLTKGVKVRNRTGVDSIKIFGAMFKHDMGEGFPLLTTKKTAYKPVRSELEFFIKGYTDKRWLQDRGNHIWDEWCNPLKVSYGHEEETRNAMFDERDLGPIYGFQWRHFGALYNGYNVDYSGKGVDQLSNMGKKLNLYWDQRSVDVPLGLPFNIASYATLLHLLAKEGDLEEGELIGHLGNTHIYVNQVEGIKEQLSRAPLDLSIIVTENFTNIFNWGYMDTKLVGYKSHPEIKFPKAI